MNRPPDFDRLARVYRWMEFASFGPWLWWCRCTFSGELRNSKRALVLGDGDGRFTARLLRANPAVVVDAVDSSAAMLRRLESRAGGCGGRLRTHLCDARRWQPPTNAQPYDLVITHFFLDCLTTAEVEKLAVDLRPLLAEDALWVVSEFATAPDWFGRTVARPVVTLLYGAFHLLTGLEVRRLPEHRQALMQAGMILQRRRDWLHGLLTSELWCFRPPVSDGDSEVPCG